MAHADVAELNRRLALSLPFSVKKIIRYDDPRVADRDSNTMLDENWWALLSGESRRGIAILRRSDSSFHSVEIMFTSVRSIREFEQRLESC